MQERQEQIKMKQRLINEEQREIEKIKISGVVSEDSDEPNLVDETGILRLDSIMDEEQIKRNKQEWNHFDKEF